MVGAFASDWTTVTQSVSPGANAVTLNVALHVPRLLLTGTMTHDGAPITGNVSIIVQPFNTAGVLTSAPLVRTAVLNSSGQYSLTVDTPTGTVRAILFADTSPFAADDGTREVTGIAPGNNPVAFDVTDVTRRLRVTGTIDRNGQPLASTSVPVTMWHTVGSDINNEVRSFTVFTDANGNYVIDRQVPAAATGARLIFAVSSGTGSGSWIDTFTFSPTGFDEQLNVRTYSIDYVPRTLTLSGTILVDGAAPSGTVPFEAVYTREGGSAAGSITTNVDPDAAGSYTAVIRLPNDAAAGVVTAKVGPFYDWYVQDLTFVDGEPATSAFDITYNPADLTVAGRIRKLGVPADFVEITVIGYDDDNHNLGAVTDSVAVDDPEGDYEITVGPFPRLASRVDYTVRFRLAGSAQFEQVGTGIDPITPGTDVSTTFVIDAQKLVVSGRLVDADDDPVVNESGIRFFLAEFDEDGHQGAGGEGQLATDSDGTFHFEWFPGIDTFSISLKISRGIELTIPLTNRPGITTAAIGDYEYIPNPYLIPGGTVTTGYDPVLDTYSYPEAVTLEIRSYRFDPAEYLADPPYELLEPARTLVFDIDDFGQYGGAAVGIPNGTNLVEIRLFIDDQTEYFSTARFIDPDDRQTQMIFDVADAPNHLTLVEETHFGVTGDQPCAQAPVRPFLRNYTYSVRIGADENTTIEVAGGIAVPDPVTGKVQFRLAYADGYDTLLSTDGHDMYDGIDGFNVGGEGSGSLPPPGDWFAEGTFDRHCGS